MTKSVPDLLTKVEGPRDVAVRALKTAVQVFLTTLPADALMNLDLGILRVGAIAALAAGGSIVMNALLVWTRS